MLNFKTQKKDGSVIKKLLYVFFFFSLFEGCLRKWLFPNYYTEIYFLKDLILLLIYIIAIKTGYLLKNKIEKITYSFVFVITLFGFFGYLKNNDLNFDLFISFILGFRSYWIYLPLAFLISNLLKIEDFQKFIRINLYLVFPYFLLIFMQSFFSPVSAINSGFNAIVMNPERPSGFFTYTTQNTYYFIFLTLCFHSYILFNKITYKKDLFYVLILNFFLSTILILLKSRTVYFFFLLILLTSLISIFFLNEKNNLKIKKFLLISVSTLLFFIFSSKVFHKQFEFSTNRINTDTYYEMLFVKKFGHKFFFSYNIYEFCEQNSSICRIIDTLYFSTKNVELSGKGIGAGTSTVATYLNQKKLYLGENENHRLISEMGIAGVLIIYLKYFFIFCMLILFIRKNDFRIAPLLVFVCILTLLFNMTYSTSFSSVLYWFCTGSLFIFLKKSTS
jgi:hypothetical protein